MVRWKADGVFVYSFIEIFASCLLITTVQDK